MLYYILKHSDQAKSFLLAYIKIKLKIIKNSNCLSILRDRNILKIF